MTAKRKENTAVPITNVRIENRSKWPTMYAVYMVSEIMQTGHGYIMSHRDIGCTFRHKGGVNVSVAPVSKACPEDTLYFYISDRIVEDGE